MSDYYVYILSNNNNKVLYVGVTSDLIRRVYEHKSKAIKGFTSKYNVHKLLYFEITQSVESAILREKFLKHKTRDFKLDLIRTNNSEFFDLYQRLL
jgi:putative endonuclease